MSRPGEDKGRERGEKRDGLGDNGEGDEREYCPPGSKYQSDDVK